MDLQRTRSPETRRPAGGWIGFLAALFLVQTAYLAVTASPDLFYVGNVFVHFFGGLVLAAWWLLAGARAVRRLAPGAGARRVFATLALILFGAAVLAGVALAVIHNVRPHRWLLQLHVATAVAAVPIALLALRGRLLRAGIVGTAAGVLVLAILPLARLARPDTANVIENPASPPASMNGESMGGDRGPFFPSSSFTSTGGRIPSNFFMTSKVCARCHADIYKQWNSSAHHFSSFNNQWYRKSVEYMQKVDSVQSSKWCGGCHDHAVLFNGMMDEPVASFIDTQEAHTGLACNSCHAITHVKDTMGNGGYYIEYPPLHDLAVSDNPMIRWLHDFAVRLDPGPHRRVFLKPFHRQQTGEFCSACHKVHLDVPVNNYRWIRGFNEYDNWQASGVSGQGARSFYYPAAPMNCADCHMPKVPSHDAGNIDGYVHSHSFLAANTAVPTANLDEQQLQNTIEFLQRNQVTVDIFAAGPPLTRLEEATPGAAGIPRISSAFGVGEEAAATIGRAGMPSARELAPIWAPVESSGFRPRRGQEMRLDVVVRTRGVGHFFPGGTIDAFDVWLELRARDENGRMIYWSGAALDDGKGPVEDGAHFYGVRMVDARANPINKRNAWATRAVAWVNLIPPGAADVAHFRIRIPEDCGDQVRFEARLNYRKFSFFNTNFAFAGEPAAGEPHASVPANSRVTPNYDDRRFDFDALPKDVSAEVREIPTLPIIVMSRDTATLQVADADAPPDAPAPAESGSSGALRWNDYGIGLLRQGAFHEAKRAFEQVTVEYPEYADGQVNLARVALQEGLLDDAEAALREALRLDPDLAKTHYFLGVVYKERGRYDQALEQFRKAAESYPRDRVVRNGIGRVLFLQKHYEKAIAALQNVLSIDPEDLAAHYTLMLCYRGLGRAEDAERESRLYERFKADEDATIILGPYLRDNPGDNRMRQRIHEQVGLPEEILEREVANLDRNGEPCVVLPGEAAAYARLVAARGAERMKAGEASDRHLGPTEADYIRPVNLQEWKARRKATASLDAEKVPITAGGENPAATRVSEETP